MDFWSSLPLLAIEQAMNQGMGCPSFAAYLVHYYVDWHARIAEYNYKLSTMRLGGFWFTGHRVNMLINNMGIQSIDHQIAQRARVERRHSGPFSLKGCVTLAVAYQC
jgi:hypothetical protein